MKRIELQPNQIIVPGEYKLGNESILKLYFRIFDRGHGKDVPPAIVIHRKTVDMFLNPAELDREDINYRADITRYKNYNRIIENAFRSGANYFLLDGNHKSVAATLTHNPISALELKLDKDTQRGKRMVESGDLFNWTVPGETLRQTMGKLRDHLLEYMIRSIGPRIFFGEVVDSYPLTIRERTEQLISNGDLPEYMVDRYRQGNKDDGVRK